MDNSELPSESDVEATLHIMFNSNAFARSSQSRRLLTHLVKETLAGNAENLKAYSIGLDVLDKPDEFDPGSDASVRVTAGRLRNALTEFYSSPSADEAPLVIEIPKGRYIPTFRRNLDSGDGWAFSRRTFKSWKIPASLISASLITVVAGYMGIRLWSADEQVVPEFSTLPVVDIPATQIAIESETSLIAFGIREQLLLDLSHIKSIRVRDIALLGQMNVPQEARNPGDYTLASSMGLDGHSMNFRLASSDQSILWADSIDLPNSDEEFYEFAKDVVGAIANRVGGERGAVSAEAFRRLTERADIENQDRQTEYLCLVLGFAFDSTKDEDIRDRARSCLTQLVENGSRNSSIHAQSALVKFLDWSRVGNGAADHPLIQDALAAARRSVQLDPSNSVGFEHLGSILSALGDRAGSISAYERGLELTPWKPSLNFLLGWQIVLSGDWENGMSMANQGVAMSPFAPGYMRIPNVMDLFRQERFDASRAAAETVVQLGDTRGYVLAIAAALAAGDLDLARELRAKADATNAYFQDDPMREVRNSFSNPSVISAYDEVLSGVEMD